MNKNESTIIRLGSVTHLDFTLLTGKDFKWSEVRFTTLGINLLAETFEIPDLNYHERVQKISTCLNIWNLNGLSTLGRVLIVRSMAILRLIYQLSMLPTPNTNCMDEIKDLLYKFLWNKKGNKIKIKVMNQEYKLRGCRMLNITVQNKSLKLSWIPCILENIDSFWLQCLKANLHFPTEHIILGNLNKKRHGKMYG